MSSARSRYLAILLLSGLSTSTFHSYGLSSSAAVVPPVSVPAAPAPTPLSLHPNVVYPQIVRVSYVEGDVRVSRGKQGEKATGAAWEAAVPDLPIEAGFTLTTGSGRAEIEFEDASTLYLADNSVLVFNQLSTKGGVPWTDLGLLSGTATLDFKPIVAGEWLILNTPSDNITVRYPQRAYLRVNSYLDAIGLTSRGNLSFNLPGWGGGRPISKGQTMMFHNGQRVYTATMPDAAASAAWDGWVGRRAAARGAAMSAMMKQAGLTEPVPGLAEMEGNGTFFACQPYGMCWAPTHGWSGTVVAEKTGVAEKVVAENVSAAPPATVSQPATAGAQSSSTQSSSVPDASIQTEVMDQVQMGGASRSALGGGGVVGQSAADLYLANHPGATLRVEEDGFPCSPETVRYLIARDPVTGAEQIIDTEVVRRGIHLGNASLSLISLGGANWTGAYPAYPGLNYRNAYPWDWAVCHAGTWIRREHRYVWVAGRKRHHRRPIHWVKVGGTKGYVPIHPRDVAGKPPVNLKDGFFAMRKDDAVERIAFDPKATVKVLDGAPKEFNKEYFAPLERAVAPKMEARSAGNGMMVGHSALAQPAKVPIVFDAKTQSFSVARQVVEGGKTTTVVRSIASAQARGDYGGGGTAGASGRSESTGRSEGASGGGYSRAASGGGGYSGGGGGGGAAIHSAPSGGGGGGAAAGGTHH